MRPEQVTVRPEDDGERVVLHLSGDVDRTAARLVVRPILIEHLLDRGQVIVELSGASLRSTSAVELFRAALAEVGGWPLARLVLAGADRETSMILRASRVHLTVPLALDVAQARLLLAIQPPRVVRSHVLPCTSTAPMLARSLVALVNEDWELPDDLYEGTMAVTTELVSNAVLHARTSCELYLACDARNMHLAVQDHLPGAETLPRRRTHDHHGYGLLIVEALSRNWGVTPNKSGKTVWALLDATGERP